MADKIEDLTINYEEGGVQLVKELDKIVLSRGAWSTVLYRYQEWDAKSGDFGQEKYTIRRYQKRYGEFKQKSKFNISSKDQAVKLVEALQRWIS